MRKYRRWRQTAETLYQGCGIGRAEKYHHANPASPGLRLCPDCAAVLSLAQKIKDKTRTRPAEAPPDTLERISDAIDEQPHRYGPDCIGRYKHLVFGQLESCYVRPAECQFCLRPAAPQSRISIAASPPCTTPPGVVIGPIVWA